MRRRIVYRRMGVLAAALAVPAMAAPSIQPLQEPTPQVIRFEIPQATTIAYAEPQVLEYTPEAAAIAVLDLPLAEPLLTVNPGPAADPMSISGSYANRSRAERCLTMAVYYEAASESVDGQRAVAQVIVNRVSHPRYPGSVCGVVFQGSDRSSGCQFSFTCDGSLNRNPGAAALARANRVARAALGGFVYANVGLATHYHATRINPYWAASLNPVGIIGAHSFYRWRGAAGQPAAFNATYRAAESLPTRNYTSASRAMPVSETASPSYTSQLPQTAGTVAEPAITASRAQDEDLPRQGAVLPQHTQSGQWLSQP